MKISLLFVIFTILPIHSHAEKLRAICYWEVKSSTESIGFNLSKPFTVELNSGNDEEVRSITTKLELLYKDYSMYVTLGKQAYERSLDKLMMMLNYPTCVIYPKDFEKDLILPGIENKSSKIEKLTREKTRRYNWPECPGMINLNSSYNYIGTNVKVQCY